MAHTPQLPAPRTKVEVRNLKSDPDDSNAYEIFVNGVASGDIYPTVASANNRARDLRQAFKQAEAVLAARAKGGN